MTLRKSSTIMQLRSPLLQFLAILRPCGSIRLALFPSVSLTHRTSGFTANGNRRAMVERLTKSSRINPGNPEMGKQDRLASYEYSRVAVTIANWKVKIGKVQELPWLVLGLSESGTNKQGLWFSGITLHSHWRGPGFDYRRVHYFFAFDLCILSFCFFLIILARPFPWVFLSFLT